MRENKVVKVIISPKFTEPLPFFTGTNKVSISLRDLVKCGSGCIQ